MAAPKDDKLHRKGNTWIIYAWLEETLPEGDVSYLRIRLHNDKEFQWIVNIQLIDESQEKSTIFTEENLLPYYLRGDASVFLGYVKIKAFYFWTLQEIYFTILQ